MRSDHVSAPRELAREFAIYVEQRPDREPMAG